MQIQFLKLNLTFFAIALLSGIAHAQVDVDRFIRDFETGSSNEKLTALRAMSSVVVRQEASTSDRSKVLKQLKSAVDIDDPVVRLTAHVEILKIGMAENDSDLGNLGLQATEDNNLNVRRGILKYFRTFFTKRYEAGKPYERLLIKKLEDEDLDIRFQAAMALHSWGISNDKILDILIDSLQLTNYAAGITHALVSDQKNRQQTVAKISSRLVEKSSQSSVYISLLSFLTPESKSAAPLILEKFDDGNHEVRASVVAAIGSLNIKDGRALEILKMATEDGSPLVRQLVLSSLVKLEPDPKVIKDTIVKLAKDSDTAVSESATASFSYFEKNFYYLQDELKSLIASGSEQEINSVLAGLISCGPMASTLTDDVIGLLKSENTEFRLRSCIALASIAEDKNKLARSLNLLLESEENSQVVFAALQMLSESEPADPASKATFVKFLDDKNEFVRVICVEGLANYKDPALVEKLIRLKPESTARGNKNLSQLGIEIVRAIVASGETGIAEALKFLDDKDSMVRCRAIRIAAHAKKPVEKLQSKIVEALRNRDPKISLCGAVATSSLREVPLELLSLMFSLTESNNRQRTVGMLRLFEMMGANASPITPEIASLVNGRYRNRFANDAKRALVKLGRHAAPALPQLVSGEMTPNKLQCIAAIGKKDAAADSMLREYIEALEDDLKTNKNVRTNLKNRRYLLFAAAALSQVSDDKTTANGIFLNALNTDNRPVALTAIGRLDPPDPALIQAVIKMLPDKQAIRTLTEIGPLATDAVPRLSELVSSKDSETSTLASLALSQIQNDPKFTIELIERIFVDNRFNFIEIKTEQRQILWSSLRYLQENHAEDATVIDLFDKIERGRYSNLRLFLRDLKKQT